MDDDFNTAKAISVLFELSKKVKDRNTTDDKRKNAALLLVELGSVLGFFKEVTAKLSSKTESISADLIELLIKYRNQFKVEKKWKLADEIREDLFKLGIKLKDTKDGTEWSTK